jgi:Zn-finger nucleic acid-binding protein
MSDKPKPQPPKSCPICRVAMQASETREAILYRCAQCGTQVKAGKMR